MATKVKSNKVKATPKTTRWKIILCSVVGTILVLTIVGAFVSIPSAMRYKQRKETFKQLNLENKGFSPRNGCIITAWPDSKGSGDTNNLKHGPAAQCSFVYNATVDQTADKIKSIAKNAGWTFKRDAYPEGAVREFHFKNDRGNYLIVELSSKLRDDNLYNADAMDQSDEAAINSDMNAGPTSVYVILNLSRDQL